MESSRKRTLHSIRRGGSLSFFLTSNIRIEVSPAAFVSFFPRGNWHWKEGEEERGRERERKEEQELERRQKGMMTHKTDNRARIP